MRWSPLRRSDRALDPGTGPVFSVRDDGRTAVITMHASLDSSSAAALESVMGALAVGGPDRVILFDLRRAPRCSFAGLSVVARFLDQGAHLIVEECWSADERDHTGTAMFAAGGQP